MIRLLNDRRIPVWLHDVFGEKMPPAAVLAILLFGGLLTAALWARYPELAQDRAAWRTVTALALIFDIFAGCAANFTQSTSNHYAADSRKRILFLAVHIHLPLVALLLQTDLALSFAVWACTIAGASLVNALIGRRSQTFAAGVLLAAGLGCVPMLPFASPFMPVVCLLFLLKVLYGFAVDHYGGAAGKSAS